MKFIVGFLYRQSLIWSPQEILFMLFLFLLTIIVCYSLHSKHEINLCQAVAIPLLVLFLLLVLGGTVFGRTETERRYELRLFWSYRKIFWGSKVFLKEVLLNILLLVPAGFLLPFVRERKTSWFHGLLFGLVISSAIELLQLVLGRGVFQFDDILNNAIGCIAGCMLGSLLLTNIRHGNRP